MRSAIQMHSVLGQNSKGNHHDLAPLGDTTRPRPFRAPLYTVSTMSMNSCLSVSAQLILLLLPVPRSIMDVLVAEEEHDRARVVQLVHRVERTAPAVLTELCYHNLVASRWLSSAALLIGTGLVPLLS